MRGTTDAGRAWRLASAALLGGATLLACYSGDPLLILAVLSAVGGLFLLGRPTRARPAVPVTAPRPLTRPASSAVPARVADRRALPLEVTAERAPQRRLRDAS